MTRRRWILFASGLIAGVVTLNGAVRVPAREIENVVAFARLYGAVRYFYPSDAAAGLDWNSFATYGVARVRRARDTQALRTTLNEMFGPLGPGIEVGARLAPLPQRGESEGALVAWRYLGVPFAWPIPRGAFTMKRTHRPYIRGAARFSQTVPASLLRNQRVKLTGRVRAIAEDSSGVAVLMLTGNRGSQESGFSDIMRDRPIRAPEWREYAIEGAVDADAADLTIGLLASGAVTADFDDLRLSVLDPTDGRWRPVALADGNFEAAANSGVNAWVQEGFRAVRVTRVVGDTPEGRQFLRIAPLPESVDAELFDEARPVAGAHIDISLGSALQARVPLVLPDDDPNGPAPTDALRALQNELSSIAVPAELRGVDDRLATTLIGWNVLRHFYPYWPQVGIDWDTRLRRQLEAAYKAASRDDEANALRLLLADARDGHAKLIDNVSETYVCPLCPLRRKDRAFLPLQFGVVNSRIVVTASALEDVPIGAIVSTIEGVRSSRRLNSELALVSGSDQWRTVRAVQEISTCQIDSVVTVRVEVADKGSRDIALRCNNAQPPAERRPTPVTELEPGIWTSMPRALKLRRWKRKSRLWRKPKP